MASDTLKNNIAEIRILIDNNNIIEAIDRLSTLAQNEANFNIADKLKTYRQTYGYMLHYLIKGSEDSSRLDVFNQTKLALMDLCDEMTADKDMSDSPDIYFSTARICRIRKFNFDFLWNELSLTDDKSDIAEAMTNDIKKDSLKDDCLRDLFDYLWTTRFNKELEDKISDKLSDNGVPHQLACYLISAITLSLLLHYDRYKFMTLIDVYEKTDNEQIAAYSLVGIILALDNHKDRIRYDRTLISRMSLWQDSLITYSRLKTVIKEIIRTRETDRVTAKMRDEVIPEIMKMRPDILKKMRDSALDTDGSMLENNPEWEEILEKNGIADKMRELTEMQSEGADLMMVTFSNLKGFPFFHKVSSWFLPFDISNPAVKIPAEFAESIESVFSLGANICDSDKYSLIFALSAMPEQQRNMMFGQFEQQLIQIAEEAKERMIRQTNADFNRPVTMFIRDLYRFFKLFRKKDEFKDPFMKPFNFLKLPVVGSMMADDELISVVGEFYFKRGFFKEALELFKHMENSYAGDHSYWEKVGYAYQSLKQYDESLDAYNKSSLLTEPGQWLLTRLAYTNKKLGNHSEAARLYSTLLENDPENISLIMNAGNSNLETGNFREALNHFYHADYIDPDNIKIKRAIARAEFLIGNFDKSAAQSERILSSDISSLKAIDFLNAGHSHLASGKISDAIHLYRKAYSMDHDNFDKAFQSDRDILEKAGVSPDDFPLILEAVRYSDKFL